MKKQQPNHLKLLILFIIAMMVCAFLGFLSGTLAGQMEKNGVDFEKIGHDFGIAFLQGVPYMFIGLCLLNVILCLMFYFRSKMKFKIWDGENEEIIEESDRLLSVGMLFSNIAFILDMFLFGAFITGEKYGLFESGNLMQILCMGIFLFVLVFNIAVQSISVNLVKKMSPEKRGDILSPHFHKDWNESLDEAEKMIVYQSAYRAFQITNTLCMALWLVLFSGALIFNTGALPIAVVTVIWLTLSCSFQIRSFQLEHGKK